MSAKILTIVLVRIFGIYCFVEAMSSTQGILYVFVMPPPGGASTIGRVVASLFPSIVLCVTGALMLLFAPRIASMIIRSPEDASPNPTWTLHDIQAVLFSVVGLLIVGSSIPHTFRWVSQVVGIFDRDFPSLLQTNPRFVRETWISVALSLVQISLGLGLFFGGRNLAGFWRRLRVGSPDISAKERT